MRNDYGKYLSDCSESTELRIHTNYNNSVRIMQGNLVQNASSKVSGVCARVYKNGVYGFSSNGEVSDETVKEVLKSAENNALFLDSRVKKNSPPLYHVNSVKYELERSFVDVSQKVLIDFAKELDEYIEKKYSDLASRTVIVHTDCMEKQLYVNNGTSAHTALPRAYIYVFMSAQTADGDTVDLFECIGGGAGYFSDFYSTTDKLYDDIDKLYNDLMKKKEGVFAEAGYSDVIIDSNIAGMIAHEAVGHTVEADLVLAGSVAKNNLGNKVASEKVSIVDFANTFNGKKAPLPVYVDDEGVECKDAVLIKDGVLVGFMNNRESGVKFGMEPCGNARAYAFSDEPLVRMRNTAILPGKDKLEDMIASIDKGYYLTATQNGQADTTGEFMFGITMGYEIVNGKLGRAIRDTTISGIAFDMLKTVDMLSDEIKWTYSGYCGKKQMMPTADGGPAVKCKVNIGGR